VRDLAAWIDFATDRGFKEVVLVGHSAGWSAVRRYQAEKQDRRVVGVVLASGAVRADTRPTDPEQLAQATRLMADGRGDDLVRDPKRSFPSFISAATFLDIADTPPEFKDFFGVQTPNPAVTRIRCPILAFFGTRGDVLRRPELLSECHGFSTVFARIYAADPGAESVSPNPKKSARPPVNPKMTFLTLCFTRE